MPILIGERKVNMTNPTGFEPVTMNRRSLLYLTELRVKKVGTFYALIFFMSGREVIRHYKCIFVGTSYAHRSSLFIKLFKSF